MALAISLAHLRTRLSELLPADAAPVARGAPLRALVREGLAALPRPGGGQTRSRWQALGAVAAHDLALAKLYEGHTDAIAILAEAGNRGIGDAGGAGDIDPYTTWGMWAAEPPGVGVVGRVDARGQLVLDGVKAWCSGAAAVDRGLLTFRQADGSGPWLASVDMRQRGVSIDASSWHAVGMADSLSADVRFDGVPARRVATERFYLDRPGFWQGGAGIAACWHGATCAIADALQRSARAAADPGWHRLLALGAIDRVLSANAALLREAADWIDAHADADARTWALRTRAATDDAAAFVLAQATRALGAGPLCRDAAFARRAADLPVFVRQSHGDRDLAALGERLLADETVPWQI